jgi:hypothetical protein
LSTKIGDKAIWTAFGSALGAEPREDTVIQGASGIEHVVQSIAVDDTNNRVIVVAAEPNPKIAALLQIDVQATMPATNVLVVRPIVFDVAAIARQLASELGSAQLDLAALRSRFDSELEGKDSQTVFSTGIGAIIKPFGTVFEHLSLPPVNQIIDVVQQLSFLDWGELGRSIKDNPNNLIIPLAGLLTRDTMSADLAFGVCPVPLYEFTDDDWDNLLSGKRREEVADRLKQLGIYQYFFPPADQIALGVSDLTTNPRSALVSAIQRVPDIGHVWGPMELVSGDVSVSEVIEALMDNGLLVEGELNVEVTEAGQAARTTVKFRPREGLLRSCWHG